MLFLKAIKIILLVFFGLFVSCLHRAWPDRLPLVSTHREGWQGRGATLFERLGLIGSVVVVDQPNALEGVNELG